MRGSIASSQALTEPNIGYVMTAVVPPASNGVGLMADESFAEATMRRIRELEELVRVRDREIARLREQVRDLQRNPESRPRRMPESRYICEVWNV